MRGWKNQGAYLTRLEAIATFCHAFDCQMMAETKAVHSERVVRQAGA
jgi:hypothetical protein